MPVGQTKRVNRVGRKAFRRAPRRLRRLVVWGWSLVFGLAAAGAVSGFKTVEIPEDRFGPPIVRTDFERCTPRRFIERLDETGGHRPAPLKKQAAGRWILRHPAWCKALLNARGRPPDLTYDPKLAGRYDIYLGLRAVDPKMSFGIKLSGEREFDVITAPAATPRHNYDFVFFWRAAADLSRRKIVIHSVGAKVYLEYFRFVPHQIVRRKFRAATEHVVICSSPGRHHAFPGIARLPDGSLGVVFRDGIAHVCPFGRILFTRSRDEGRTWSAPVCIWDSPSDDRDPSIHALPSGRVLATFHTWNSWMASPALRERYAAQSARIRRDGLHAYTGSKIMFSSDSGRTWTKPVKIPAFTPHGPTPAPDGALYYPTWRDRGGRRRLLIFRSKDQGRTWDRFAEVGASAAGAPEQRIVYGEPFLAIPPHGPWILTIRVDKDGYARQALSADGRRWSAIRKTKVRGYPQHILALADGRLLMTYGYRFRPYGIRACVSRDHGKSWDVEREILLRSGLSSPDLGYPVSIQLHDGRVLTVYYYRRPDGSSTIEGAFYRP